MLALVGSYTLDDGRFVISGLTRIGTGSRRVAPKIGPLSKTLWQAVAIAANSCTGWTRSVEIQLATMSRNTRDHDRILQDLEAMLWLSRVARRRNLCRAFDRKDHSKLAPYMIAMSLVRLP